MLAGHFAMVAGVDNERILQLTGFRERVQQASDFVVQVGDEPVIGGAGTADLLFRKDFRRSKHGAHALKDGMLLRRVLRFWQVYLVQRVHVPVALRDYQREMRRDEAHVQRPRTFLPRRITNVCQGGRLNLIVYLDFTRCARPGLGHTRPRFGSRQDAALPGMDAMRIGSVQIERELRLEAVQLIRPHEVLLAREGGVIPHPPQQVRPRYRIR